MTPHAPAFHIREARESDAAALLALRRALFAETSYLLWEPGEFTIGEAEEAERIRRLKGRANCTLLVAEHDGELVAFVAAIGGERNRQRHVATLALGVARAHWSRGIASALLEECKRWAPGAGVSRIDLTVHTENARAVALYRRLGFEIEGTRRAALRVDGAFVDEYQMALLLGQPAPPRAAPVSTG